MFMTVTVDVDDRIKHTLESWFAYTHSKRIDVTVRTGRRLVAVFAETVGDHECVVFYVMW